MRSDSLELPNNTVLQNRYQIKRTIGAGGFGITYEAFDMLNKLKCAIKEFAPMDISVRASDGISLVPITQDKRPIFEHGKRRFLEEAEILKQLRNVRAVVSITDYFNENGTCYFVMEFLDGVTLKALAKQMGGRIGYEDAMPLLREIGISLHQVHVQSNIFHRDISPDNIILTLDGGTKIIDFGNAKFIMSDGQQQLSVVLKPGFAPFEQYSSKGKQGSYTDVYSLAGTFYYILSGKMLPHAPERVAGTPYEKLKNMGLGIPDYISDAFDHALMIRYQERTQTVKDFLQELRLLQGNAAVQMPSAVSPVQGSAVQTPRAASTVQESVAQTPRAVSPVQGSVAQTPRAAGSVQRYVGKVKKPYVDVTNYGMQPMRYFIPENSLVKIGRSQVQAEITLVGDLCVSKYHCDLFYDTIEKVFYLQDHSSNGTYLNGQRLERERIYILQEGQLFTVGNQIITLKVGTVYE